MTLTVYLLVKRVTGKRSHVCSDGTQWPLAHCHLETGGVL